MKAKITIGIILLLIGSSPSTFSQGTAYANIFATVIAPIGISMATDNDFGAIVVSKKNASLSLSSGTEVTASGIKLDQNGTATVASFSLTDTNHSTFDITLPREIIKIGENNLNALIVSNFSSINILTSTLNGMRREVTIAANIHVADNQLINDYTALNPFPVTLNYN
jgi:hypothetical protein